MRGVEIQPFSDEHLDAAARSPGDAAHTASRSRTATACEHRLQGRGRGSLAGRVGLRRRRARNGESSATSSACSATRPGGRTSGSRAPDTPSAEPELVRDLYAAAAAQWVEEGRHRALRARPGHRPARSSTPGSGSLSESSTPPAIQETPPKPIDLVPAGASCPARRRRRRRRGRATRPRAPPPSGAFAGFRDSRPLDPTEESREEFQKEVDDPRGRAVRRPSSKGRGRALVALVPVEQSSMHTGLARPERAAFLGFAATLPEARGSGAGLALTDAAFAWARESVTTPPWSWTGERRTSSRRGSGRLGVFAEPSSGSTARSLSAATPSGVRLAACSSRRRRGRRRARTAAAGRPDRRRRRGCSRCSALPARRTVARSARPARRPRDVVVEPPALPIPGSPADPRRTAIAATMIELDRAGAPLEKQTLLVAGGLARQARAPGARAARPPGVRSAVPRPCRGTRRGEPGPRGGWSKPEGRFSFTRHSPRRTSSSRSALLRPS